MKLKLCLYAASCYNNKLAHHLEFMHYCPNGLACEKIGLAEHTHLFTHEPPAKNPKKSFPNNFGGNYANYNSNYTNPNYNSNYSLYNYNNFNASFNPQYQKNPNKQQNKQNKQGLPPQQKQPKLKQGLSDSDQAHSVSDQNWQNRTGNPNPNYPYQPGLASSDEAQKEGSEGTNFFPAYQQSYPSLQGSTNMNASNPKAHSSHDNASHDVHVQQPRRQHYQPQYHAVQYPPFYSYPQYPPYQMPMYPYQYAQYEYDPAYWNPEPMEYGQHPSHGVPHEDDEDNDEEYLDEEAEDFYEEFLNTLKNQKNATSTTSKPNSKQEDELDDDMCREFEKFTLEMDDTVYYQMEARATQGTDVSPVDQLATPMENHSK
jgi:hypothetical protein